MQDGAGWLMICQSQTSYSQTLCKMGEVTVSVVLALLLLLFTHAYTEHLLSPKELRLTLIP